MTPCACPPNRHQQKHESSRPWGWYDGIDEGGRFKVKRIQVKPKVGLSLQKHHHRAEQWIVVTGTAEITNEYKALTPTENQSTFITQGEVHHLANHDSCLRSSKCNRTATWAKTILRGLKTTIAEHIESHPKEVNEIPS